MLAQSKWVIPSRFALHLTAEDGLVTRHHVYEDSLAVAQAFDGRELD
jgi:hypothetical protein